MSPLDETGLYKPWSPVCVLLLLYVRLSHNVVYNYNLYTKRSHTYAKDPVVHVRQSSVEYGNTQHALKV